MTRLIVAAAVLVGFSQVAAGQNKDQQTARQYGWIYDNLDAGITEARETGKPLMVVIRCPP